MSIENVGNLVCPASYDLGEQLRAVLVSVTEGEDKPLKYPTIFNTADVAIVTKTDLAAAAGFDRDPLLRNIERREAAARSAGGMCADRRRSRRMDRVHRAMCRRLDGGACCLNVARGSTRSPRAFQTDSS